MQIKNNHISNSFFKISKIPHHICNMGHNERIAYMNKIKGFIKEFKNQVKNLSPENKKTDPKILNFPLPVFMWAYYGLSIKEPLQDLISIYKDVFSDYIKKIDEKFSCKNSLNKPYKKILFCSGRLCRDTTSVYRSTYEIINHLSKVPDFHVDLMTKFPIKEEVQKKYSNCKNILPIKSIEQNIDLIGGGRYDIIIYPDMNMEESTSCIGLFRLAPHQITTFGHSETSGIADHFVTSKFYETSTPEDNYIENPIVFNSLALKYKTINIEEYISDFKPKSYFQLPSESKIYYCNSSFFKMGKEMFDIFKGILDSDPLAIICLTKLNVEYWDDLFFKSLDSYLDFKYKNRIRFIKRLNYKENLNFLYNSDVFIESYPFGNMNSTLESLSAGLPVVSMPTTKINGRFTYGFYKKIGLEKKYCANNIEGYIKTAVSVANEKIEKNDLIESSKILFEEEESVIEWENLLRSLS